IQPKGGGVFQDSPIAAGRRLVFDVDGTAIESLDLAVNSHNQNNLITQAQDLLRLLLKARAYGSVSWQDDPVWIKAKATCETNARYAQIISFSIPQLDNPYAQPFFSAAQIAAMDDITLSIERDHWLSEQPEAQVDVTASNSQAWNYGSAGTFGTSTEQGLYISNKQVVAQLSHIFVDDGGSFGSNLFPVSGAFQLWPASPAVDDAVYFGISTALTNSGPFDNLIFDITTPASATGSYTGRWEYWDGLNTDWLLLNATDNTGVSTSFDTAGYNSVHWEPPLRWEPTAVNGVTGYWVRNRLSALSGTGTPPTQGNTPLITANNAFIEVAADEIGGDIPALMKLELVNKSDSGLLGWYDRRVIMGLRSYSRGANFQAYLNVADEQNPSGVSVTAGTNTAFATDPQAPTGRKARYNPTATEQMLTRATITLDSTIARDFYGTFHVYLRATADNIGIEARMQFVTLSGGIIQTTPTQVIPNTAFFAPLDFGQVTFPLAGYLKASEVGDSFQIIIQASADDGTPNFDMYDVILIPVDEWALGTSDPNDVLINSGGYVNEGKLLDVDSITPKTDIRTLVRYASNLQVSAEWEPVTGGPAIWQSNARQRLWIFASQTVDINAYTFLGHLVRPYKSQRYLGMRGDR
ncbi:MAG TPA: hypothetical protein VEC96_07845, partial [Anaerolineae bacterium]|nr:hypothetical protein [Anaerolineae bacterium]